MFFENFGVLIEKKKVSRSVFKIKFGNSAKLGWSSRVHTRSFIWWVWNLWEIFKRGGNFLQKAVFAIGSRIVFWAFIYEFVRKGIKIVNWKSFLKKLVNKLGIFLRSGIFYCIFSILFFTVFFRCVFRNPVWGECLGRTFEVVLPIIPCEKHT